MRIHFSTPLNWSVGRPMGKSFLRTEEKGGALQQVDRGFFQHPVRVRPVRAIFSFG
jgi:hypothetical protein